MTRMDIINALLKKNNGSTYLEIGISGGHSFVKINASKKIAVDPEINVSKSKKIKALFSDINNIFNEYFEVTSDVFFEKHNDILKKYPPDVVFVDGLHTYEQSFIDVLNSMKYIKENGFIVMHDCNPLSETEAYPTTSIKEVKKLNLPGFNGNWNGDVWKAILHLKKEFKELNIFVLDTDCGVGVISGNFNLYKNENNISHKESIGKLSYSFLEKDRAKILNLQPTEYFTKFLRTGYFL